MSVTSGVEGALKNHEDGNCVCVCVEVEAAVTVGVRVGRGAGRGMGVRLVRTGAVRVESDLNHKPDLAYSSDSKRVSVY